MVTRKSLVVRGVIEQNIFLIRGQKVMLDKDLALLYQVKPIALRQQVKRNKDRFPKDFLFQLSAREVGVLVSQNVIPSKQSLGGYRPYAFTEQGVAMLSGVLKSKRAIQVNILIMRAFIRLRGMFKAHKNLTRKLSELEQRIGRHDEDIHNIFDAIRQLMTSPPEPPNPPGSAYENLSTTFRNFMSGRAGCRFILPGRRGGASFWKNRD